MTLVLRRLTIGNFRKFRDPICIEGLCAGLNVVIEPNEAGKSTLLEALRAAFFVRHSTKGQLAQSYLPHGDAVGPEISVAFDVAGNPWHVSKRFLRGASVELEGPAGRAQGEDAEVRLQELLGAARGSSSRVDPATQGVLGLLWVMQGDGLDTRPPGPMVRDAVHATLEGEVGAILGGAVHDAVRTRVDAQFAEYWTATGRLGGRQTAASERHSDAAAAADEAETRLAALERNFGELDDARARLKLLDRDIADSEGGTERADLEKSLGVARVASQLLATRRAEHDAAKTRYDALEDLSLRHASAIDQRERLVETQAEADALNSAARTEIDEAQAAHDAAREITQEARLAKQAAADALAQGEATLLEARHKEARQAARERHVELLALEQALESALEASEKLIPGDAIEELEASEREIAEARALLDAGAVRIALEGNLDGIALDGTPWDGSERLVSSDARIMLSDQAAILVKPPAGTQSAEARLGGARETLAGLLAQWNVESLAAARVRNEAARDAAADIRTLAARIETATPADSGMGLAAGPEALKLLVASLGEETAEPVEAVSLETLAAAAAHTAKLLARSEVVEQSKLDDLREAEARSAPRASDAAVAAAALDNNRFQLEAIEARAEFAGLGDALAAARETLAVAAVELAEAERNATAHDEAAILRRIATIDARTRAASNRRGELDRAIAQLEAAIEIEGGKGLADRAVAAREEADAAAAALHRISEEAAAIKMLRAALDDARAAASQSFVGPITRRAQHYIDRVLPASEPRFADDLALGAVVRAGIAEDSATLSRGTQEQLAILTRLAFADMLLEEGQPVSLILDDPLAYSDDARLEIMSEILVDAAQRMQIIILTCRDRAFRHLPGTHLRIANVG
jgi:DNA repair exonuclease SbcCD ATPase subunit